MKKGVEVRFSCPSQLCLNPFLNLHSVKKFLKPLAQQYLPAYFCPAFEKALGHGVMVTQQILVLLFRVRVLVTQQEKAFPANVGKAFLMEKRQYVYAVGGA